MGNVNFYLKKPDGNNNCLVFLRYFYNGKKLDFSFGQSIEAKNWNSEKQRVKNNKYTTEDGRHSLNDLLDALEKVLKNAYNKEIKNGLPEPQTLKNHLSAFVNQNETAELSRKKPGN